MYSTAFWCLIVVYCVFWLYCVTTVTPFIERSEGWSLRSVGVLDQSQQECLFSSLKFKSTANFSAPAQEGNFFFLSGRSAQTKIHNFPIKLSHLFRTSRHVWLSSSACDHCCTYQLICIMTTSTDTTVARAEMTRQLHSCTVKKRVLAPVSVFFSFAHPWQLLYLLRYFNRPLKF